METNNVDPNLGKLVKILTPLAKRVYGNQSATGARKTINTKDPVLGKVCKVLYDSFDKGQCPFAGGYKDASRRTSGYGQERYFRSGMIVFVSHPWLEPIVTVWDNSIYAPKMDVVPASDRVKFPRYLPSEIQCQHVSAAYRLQDYPFSYSYGGINTSRVFNDVVWGMGPLALMPTPEAAVASGALDQPHVTRCINYLSECGLSAEDTYPNRYLISFLLLIARHRCPELALMSVLYEEVGRIWGVCGDKISKALPWPVGLPTGIKPVNLSTGIRPVDLSIGVGPTDLPVDFMPIDLPALEA